MNADILRPKLWRLRQLAQLLCLSEEWLQQEAEAGRIPCLRAGDVLLFDPAAVRAELLRRAQEPAIEKGAGR